MSHTFEDLKDGLPEEKFAEAQERAQEVLAAQTIEPASLSEEAADIEDHLLRFAREGVRRNGACRPVIAALVGLELQIFHPQWNSAEEKAQEFHYINNYLEDLDPSVAVALLPGLYGEDGSPDSAIILVTRTRKGKSMKIYPYRISTHDVTWLDEVEADDFTTNVLRVPRVD